MAHLFEQRGSDEAGDLHTHQVRIGGSDGAGCPAREEAARNFLGIAWVCTLFLGLSTNQSAEPTLWPLMSVWVRLGLVPRRLTRSDSSKPPSSALDELMFTPGRPRRASATLCAGSLPTSSAVTTSRRASALRLTSSDFWRLARMPVTTTSSISSASAAAVAEAAMTV